MSLKPGAVPYEFPDPREVPAQPLPEKEPAPQEAPAPKQPDREPVPA